MFQNNNFYGHFYHAYLGSNKIIITCENRYLIWNTYYTYKTEAASLLDPYMKIISQTFVNFITIYFYSNGIYKGSIMYFFNIRVAYQCKTMGN